MGDNQMSKNDFIREQIKQKPLNKRKIIINVCVAALCGAVFAIVACIVFSFFYPMFQKQVEGEVADSESETDLSMEYSTEQDIEEKSTEPQKAPEESPVIVDVSLSIEDYQDLQNQLYAIGNVANRSIVAITSVKSDTDWFNNSFETQGQGSGVIIANDRDEIFILTEKNVISNAKRMSVTFQNDAVAEAALRKYDADTGIAIISVDKEQLDPATLHDITVAKIGNSKKVTKGAIVIALGSPLGTSFSVLTGNVTSTENSVSKMDDNYSVFTTDIVASKNGSGVLIDSQGEVIGLVMQGYNTSDAGNTLTAVAISDVTSVIEFLMDGKDIPYLGTSVITVNDKIAYENDIPKGVYIKEVAVDSPAMVAGLQSGDVITKVNKVTLFTVSSYSEQVMQMVPGEKYQIVVQRQGANGYYEVKCEVEAGILE